MPLLLLPIFFFAFQVQFSSQNAEQMARNAYRKAQSQYEAGAAMERAGAYDRALGSYQRAYDELQVSLPTGLGTDSFGEFTPENTYPAAAVLGSSIALDLARVHRLLGRTTSPYYLGNLAIAESNALDILLSSQMSQRCDDKRGGTGLPRVIWWQPPLPTDRAAAYFNLGLYQLLRDQFGSARACFDEVLRIDPRNQAALNYKLALADTSNNCQFCLAPGEKNLLKAGLSIGAALVAKRYPLGVPIAAVVIGYLIDAIPSR